jgi:sugar phosphate isomerase/epimerase
MTSRRNLLRAGATLAVLGAISPVLARTRAPLGLVEITVSRELSQDYAGTLRKIAAMGYTHFGFRMGRGGSSPNNPSSRDKALMVSDAGLEIGAVRLGNLAQSYERDIEDAAAIGAKTIVMSAAPVFTSGPTLGVADRAAFEAWLPNLAALADKCRASGLRLGYHNHWWDLLPLDGGETPLDTIAQNIAPSDLSFEVDLAWTWYAGVAPLDLLARLAPRVSSMHLKDIDRSRANPFGPNAGRAEQSAYTGNQAVVIGRGEMGYASLLPRIRRLTSAIGYIEIDRPDDGLVAAAEASQFFRQHR